MTNSFRIKRRKRLSQREITDIVTWLVNHQVELNITNNTVRASQQYTDSGTKAYKSLFAIICNYRNENGQTLHDVFIDSSANEIVSQTIKMLQINLKNQINLGATK